MKHSCYVKHRNNVSGHRVAAEKKRIQVWELKRKLKSSWLKKKKEKKVMDRALGEAAVMSGVYECVGV